MIRYIFVHGLSGWGSYDKINRMVPYWGLLGGDLTKYLTKCGYPSYAASVSPEGSAWDRACELYAQLTGRIVDYGKAHSERCRHKRYGEDFRGRPLIPDWEEGCGIVLIGHSFGGATVRLLTELLVNGSEEERAAAKHDAFKQSDRNCEPISDLFIGGQKGRVKAILTLASPSNGTTAYDLYEDRTFDPGSVDISPRDMRMSKYFDKRRRGERDGRIDADYADHDMFIDNAIELNRHISTFDDIYYFAVPCSSTRIIKDGTSRPIHRITEGMLCKVSSHMGAYTGVTAGGVVIDRRWQENDGLVNTVSAMAPSGAPSVRFIPEYSAAKSGIWNILPVYKGDHMSLQGGYMKIRNIRPYYRKLIEMIDKVIAE